MITLTKRKKPNVLVKNETNWTNELMDYLNASKKVPESLKGKYRHTEIKTELLKETNNKCAYCESKISHIDYGDIEHILPKSIVPDKTFLWENLTIGCTICNQNKTNYYNPNFPLLNPYTDKPEEKLLFAGPMVVAAVGSQSASITIKKLDLNRPALFEKRHDFLNKIEPLIRQYELTNDATLRQLLLDDLIASTKPEHEYSLMLKQFLAQLAITA
ncbi:HNH endonuclease domain-containing protein [Lysinibacillus sp. NPDC097214]|uniref:HNH endonuclease domain-containing protein n=1 Tax=Lysinibacillus sp. NPDC097214 TaxID=3390584 RepID=UPI003D006E53